ncbi:unnamed protein product [Leptosia nina]|uniref:Uncharacterized protein n=1 Tax=Leptosia nina TaxID=320188 RepID=A0AAV1IXI9_9NEOP
MCGSIIPLLIRAALCDEETKRGPRDTGTRQERSLGGEKTQCDRRCFWFNCAQFVRRLRRVNEELRHAGRGKGIRAAHDLHRADASGQKEYDRFAMSAAAWMANRARWRPTTVERVVVRDVFSAEKSVRVEARRRQPCSEDLGSFECSF